MRRSKTDLDPAVVAEIAAKSTKELEAATGTHARAVESIRDAMAEDEDVIAAKAKYDEVRADYQSDIKKEKQLLRAHYKELMTRGTEVTEGNPKRSTHNPSICVKFSKPLFPRGRRHRTGP